MEALRYLAKERMLVAELSGMVGAQPGELRDKVDALLGRVKDAEREIARLKQEQVQAEAASLVEQAQDISAVKVLTHHAGDLPADQVRSLVLSLRARLGDASGSVVAVTGVNAGRPVVVIATNQSARDRGIQAGALVKQAASVLGGGGGGKPDVAQGGGQDPSKVDEALSAVACAIRQTLD